MARRLVKLGHEVTIYYIISDPNSHQGWFSTLEDGITVHWIPILSNSMSFGQRLLAFVKFGVLGGNRSICTGGCCLRYAPLTVAIPGALASFWQRAPLVHQIRDLWPQVP